MQGRMYRESFPAADMSLERATENVPDDGYFYLIVHGDVVQRFRTEKAALAEYRAVREAYLAEHPPTRQAAILEQLIREDQSRLTNRELIWGPEDFERQVLAGGTRAAARGLGVLAAGVGLD